ncbi:hypothetical protein HK101_002749 [Irineochytrium annulatum]|nr:hypothetical protein HK101_002749 [Irineochytrium annulatum]
MSMSVRFVKPLAARDSWTDDHVSTSPPPLLFIGIGVMAFFILVTIAVVLWRMHYIKTVVANRRALCGVTPGLGCVGAGGPPPYAVYGAGVGGPVMGGTLYPAGGPMYTAGVAGGPYATGGPYLAAGGPPPAGMSTGGMTTPRIGFIGLGQMGYPMASNLHAKTGSTRSSFLVYDAHADTARKFAASHGSTVAVTTSPRDLARDADVIVTMLPAGPHVREVYLDAERGILGGLAGRGKGEAVVIDSSTIDVKTARDVAAAAGTAGQVMLDAPVSGGTNGAAAATLTFMVGAPDLKAFEWARDGVLKHMGANFVHCGEVGNGQVAKICNNMLLGISMVAASETMNLGVRLGMDPKLLASILNTSSGRCWSTDTYNPCPGVLPNVPASKDYEGGFGTALMAKDLGLAVAAAGEAKATVTLGAIANQIYSQVSSTPGFEKKDFSSIYKWLNDNAVRMSKK